MAQVEDLTNKEVMLYKTAFLAAFPAKEVCGIPIPRIYKAAINNPQYRGEWKKAINTELVALLEAET
jgi:hypothetical protein